MDFQPELEEKHETFQVSTSCRICAQNLKIPSKRIARAEDFCKDIQSVSEVTHTHIPISETHLNFGKWQRT